jgi:hypothetical protein
MRAGWEEHVIFGKGGGEQMSVDRLINLIERYRFDFPVKFLPL